MSECMIGRRCNILSRGNVMSIEQVVLVIIVWLLVLNISTEYKYNKVCDRLDVIEQSISQSKTSSKR